MASPATPLPQPNEALVTLRDSQRLSPREKKSAESIAKFLFMAQRWQEYFDRQASSLALATAVVNTAEALDQTASIAATDMSGGSLPAGTYEFEWFVSIRTAAGVSSSVIVTVDFAYRGATKTLSYATVNGNTTATFSHGGGIIVIDNASPIRYATTYASNPAGAMHYDLILVLRRVDA